MLPERRGNTALDYFDNLSAGVGGKSCIQGSNDYIHLSYSAILNMADRSHSESLVANFYPIIHSRLSSRLITLPR
jgi:hypothetical protein